ncbi:MAG: HAD-IC family P-type ATPase, partial [Clostridia bacterium]|nr:HAD-IC family P-type ATPase [Clostridia bacterium]
MNGTKKQKPQYKALDAREVEESRKKHGANLLSRQKGKSFFRQFLSNLNDPVIRILLVALAINLLLLFRQSDWVESAGIAIAVLLATLISTLSEHSSQKAFSALSEESAKTLSRVRRSEGVCELPIGEIVVGDIVLLSPGEQIPADGLLISGEIKSDQSAMTGESREIRKIPSSDT